MEIVDVIQSFMEQYGIISVFIVVFLEYSNVPIPSEIVLPMVGVCVSSGVVSMVDAILVTLVAGVFGSLVNYYLGYKFGNPLVKKIIEVQPRMKKSVDASMWWIKKYGEMAIMVSRVVPIARTMISIPAGVIKMKLLTFVAYSSLGIGVWNTLLIYLGFVCGNNMDVIAAVLEKYSIFVIGVAIMGSVFYLLKLKKVSENKKSKKVENNYT